MKTTPLYRELELVGGRHKACTPSALAGCEHILATAEVVRLSGTDATRANLAVQACVAIKSCIAEITDVRTRCVAEAVMCLLPERHGTLTKQRVELLRNNPALAQHRHAVTAEFYKYHRRIALQRLYEYLRRDLEHEPDWLQFPVRGRQPEPRLTADQYSAVITMIRALADVHYAALGTMFISRFDDRVAAEGLEIVSVYKDGRIPSDDFLFEALAAYDISLSGFLGSADSWLSTRLEPWRDAWLRTHIEGVMVVRGDDRELLRRWHLERWSHLDDLEAVLGEWTPQPVSEVTQTQIADFYVNRWRPWFNRQRPRYATTRELAIQRIANLASGAYGVLRAGIPVYVDVDGAPQDVMLKIQTRYDAIDPSLPYWHFLTQFFSESPFDVNGLHYEPPLGPVWKNIAITKPGVRTA